MASSADSEIDKPGAQKRVELPDVNINTGVQSINAERATSMNQLCNSAISTTIYSYVKNVWRVRKGKNPRANPSRDDGIGIDCYDVASLILLRKCDSLGSTAASLPALLGAYVILWANKDIEVCTTSGHFCEDIENMALCIVRRVWSTTFDIMKNTKHCQIES